MCRWRVAKPDEWLLVLRDGRLIGQGIGLRAFCGCPEATGGWWMGFVVTKEMVGEGWLPDLFIFFNCLFIQYIYILYNYVYVYVCIHVFWGDCSHRMSNASAWFFFTFASSPCIFWVIEVAGFGGQVSSHHSEDPISGRTSGQRDARCRAAWRFWGFLGDFGDPTGKFGAGKDRVEGFGDELGSFWL